jgi:hypothetical protein
MAEPIVPFDLVESCCAARAVAKCDWATIIEATQIVAQRRKVIRNAPRLAPADKRGSEGSRVSQLGRAAKNGWKRQSFVVKQQID